MMELRRAMFFDQAVDCVKAVACRPGLSPPLGLKKKYIHQRSCFPR